ncbi:peptide/nickel transport system permease protein [Stella humosa]|uniref:Peptide/nickel transport system permease protein n=1 Tax=Stella humosa TaxID=94 RepID=A0A3N1KX96_9PROT|nr:ABC transporter permease [Stella humosa]ROP84494.1 peptide/nickel transport system permease protein [Stella humosa]BBK34014.1 ABC transporter permease [Stella humosa]
MERLEFIAQRVLKGIVVLVGIVVLNFLLIRLAPGDPAAVMAGEAGASDELFLQQLRAQFGLDRPLLEQLWAYVANILSFDFGFSYRQQRPVVDLLAERLPPTLLLTGTAFVLSLVAGVTLGVMAARRAGRWSDSAITVVALFFYATPLFWVGLMGVLLFSVTLGWLPAFGMASVGVKLTGFAYLADVGRHLVLPALTLTLFHMAVYARMTRASMLEVRDLDFVRTARAKGVDEGSILRRHVLRNAILPVVTIAGMKAGYLLGGSIVVETVFAWPGIGRLAYEAVLQRDYNVLLGVFLVTSALVIAVNLATDVIYSLVDPRIELGA